jgi:formylglycine-generating enzyme
VNLARAAGGPLIAVMLVALCACGSTAATVPYGETARSCHARGPGTGHDCGANDDCCADTLVRGGTFLRSYDGDFFTDSTNPATVSDVRLDRYEVTVGRFRAFVEAGGATRAAPPAAAAGKDPNRPDDTGWDPAYDANLLEAGGLPLALACSPFDTWTPQPGEHERHPMNCMTWYEAYAFCIWDGGRLPTEAEWNNAASSGAEQRKYPWGSADPGPNTELAVYGCYFGGGTGGPGTCTGAEHIAPVGSAPAGAARSPDGDIHDLAGNVWEWVADAYDSPYPKPCFDCAATQPSSDRGARGGSFYGMALELRASIRHHSPATIRHAMFGVRCARSP